MFKQYCVLYKKLVQKNLIKIAFLSVFLASCSSLFQGGSTGEVRSQLKNNSSYYTQMANLAQSSDDKINYQLLTIRAYIEENRLPAVKDLAKTLKGLDADQLQDLNLSLSLVYALERKNQMASDLLRQIKFKDLSHDQKARYYETTATVAKNTNNLLDILKSRIEINHLVFDNISKQKNIDKLWNELTKAHPAKIKSINSAGNLEMAAWLDLANIYHDNIQNPAAMPDLINQWRETYRQLDISYMLPSSLKAMMNFKVRDIGNIAMLLPLSDDTKIIGDMIKKGFLEANQNQLRVKFYDTNKLELDSILASIEKNNIKTVIGPLLKNRLADFMQIVPDDITVLGLNNINSYKHNNNTCYFSLAPEDEARSTADKISLDNKQNPFVIVSNSDYFQRQALTFVDQWQKLKQTQTNVQYFNNIDEANAILQAISDGQISTDSIYIIADYNDTLAIKTFLDNELNSTIALYTTSKLHNSNSTASVNTGLEQIYFPEISLFDDSHSDELRKALSYAKGDFSLVRLYALGYDAYAVINKFNELHFIPDFKLAGLTGEIQSNQNCVLERNLTWFKFKNGYLTNADKTFN